MIRSVKKVIDMKTYSLGNIFPRAICFCRAFSGPPSWILAWSSCIRAMTSPNWKALSMNSVDEVSSLVGNTEIAEA